MNISKRRMLIGFLSITFAYQPIAAEGPRSRTPTTQERPNAQSTGLLEQCSLYLRFGEGDKDIEVDDALKIGLCMGYIDGFSDGLVVENVVGAAKQKLICFPKASLGQRIRIVVKYLKDHPEHLHLDASVTVYKAFYDAFPCTQ